MFLARKKINQVDINEELRTVVRQGMRENKLSVTEVAKKTKIPRSTLYTYLDGTSRFSQEALFSLYNECKINVFQVFAPFINARKDYDDFVNKKDEKENNDEN